MKYQFSRFSVKSEKSFLQFSVKTKDNENWIYTGSVKTKDNENSTKNGAVKTVKSDLSMKYQTSDISLIIYRFSLYLYPFSAVQETKFLQNQETKFVYS